MFRLFKNTLQNSFEIKSFSWDNSASKQNSKKNEQNFGINLHWELKSLLFEHKKSSNGNSGWNYNEILQNMVNYEVSIKTIIIFQSRILKHQNSKEYMQNVALIC